MRTRLRAIVLIATLALLATACGDDTTDTASNAGGGSGKITVVATTTVVQDFVRVIAGDRVTLVGILKPNVDPHDYEPSPADTKAVADADLIVANGAGIEEWLEKLVDSAGPTAPVIDLSENVTLRGGSDEHSEGAKDEHSEGAKDEHSEGAKDEHSEGAKDEHSHGGEDPHIWHNPMNAKIMVTDLTAALVTADAANAPTYESNRDAYLTELDTLDAEIEQQISTLTNKRLVTNHDAFGYYVDRYGLDFVGSIIPSFDSSAEMSASDLSDLVAKIKDQDVQAIFSESSLPPKTAEAIATEAGVKVVEGEDALYGDGLGPAGSSGATYLEMMRHNTDTIVAGLS